MYIICLAEEVAVTALICYVRSEREPKGRSAYLYFVMFTFEWLLRGHVGH